MEEEIWKQIEEFPNYEVSNFGNIYNIKTDMIMRTSKTLWGHTKITLTSEWGNARFTRSVALLVAEAFIDPPNFMCDQVIVLNGDFSNMAASNLAWRPRWFAWKYTRQLKTRQPIQYENLQVRNVITGEVYNSIVDAGVAEGLLFDNIWRSTYTGEPVYPVGSVFEVIKRV